MINKKTKLWLLWYDIYYYDMKWFSASLWNRSPPHRVQGQEIQGKYFHQPNMRHIYLYFFSSGWSLSFYMHNLNIIRKVICILPELTNTKCGIPKIQKGEETLSIHRCTLSNTVSLRLKITKIVGQGLRFQWHMCYVYQRHKIIHTLAILIWYTRTNAQTHARTCTCTHAQIHLG